MPPDYESGAASLDFASSVGHYRKVAPSFVACPPCTKSKTTIGGGFPTVGPPISIPTVIVNNSSVHIYRSNPYSDYIDWAGDENGMTAATSSINCGEGGSVTNSTIYCYTIYGNTTDKTVTYDADGNPTEQLAE